MCRRRLDGSRCELRGYTYTVFSEDELRDLRETIQWLKVSEKSFDFWNNDDDAVYDSL